VVKPWQVKSWCIPQASASFVAKREDLLAGYQRPYHPKRPQGCLDAARQERHRTPKGTLPRQPGQPVRQDSE
jgi:hypothetical protein